MAEKEEVEVAVVVKTSLTGEMNPEAISRLEKLWRFVLWILVITLWPKGRQKRVQISQWLEVSEPLILVRIPQYEEKEWDGHAFCKNIFEVMDQ